MRIAFLGTGIMGGPMARNLVAAGHDVTVWNRTPEKANGLGATVADSPGAAVDGAEVVITMLADGPADRLTAAVPSLDPGAWRVEWRVLSTDGHVVSGRFSFRVAR